MNTDGTGGLDLGWAMGKTAASIRFVRFAESYISSCTDVVIIGLLTDQINKIKSGEVDLTEHCTPEEFILRAQK